MSEIKPHALKNRIVLAHPSQTELARLIEESGAKALFWPKLSIQTPESFTDLDEAIESLYGYDWLIFVNSVSADSFLARFRHLGHETNELDATRVCALGDSTVAVLEQAQVHVDLVCGRLSAAAVIESIANYLGGRDKLAGLTFALPQAAIGRGYLKPLLEDAGARADVVAAYQTTSGGDSSLLRLRTILDSGGVDCLAFTCPAEVNDFAQLFDTNDFSRLAGIDVATSDDAAATAAALGFITTIKPNGPGIQALVDAISSHFAI
ncbi:MAG TPA: uroporphyrinogen-III synthase [Pyrinomonadaceae bacterium]|nr:uroporphyrinogen-III synthase [Pyrinomonadaceae bacterium]